MSPFLSILIVNYNGAHFISACIDSILNATIRYPYEIIVLDNDSKDESINALQPYTDKLTLIKSPDNLGFSKGNNKAASYAKGSHLLLLNNDTVLDPNALQHLLDFYLNTPDAGAITPRLLNEDGSIQIQGSSLGAFRFKSNKTRSVPFICGACLLISHELYKSIGGLDENVFFYNEDIILCKAVQKRGKKLYHVPTATVIHFGGLSTKTRKMKSIIEGYRGSLYISRKFYPLPIHYLFRILLLVDLFPKLIFYGLFSLINRKKLEQLKAYMIILKINATGEFPKP